MARGLYFPVCWDSALYSMLLLPYGLKASGASVIVYRAACLV